MSKTKLNIRKIIAGVLWITISAGAVVLLVAAVKTKNTKTCKGIDIDISGVSNNFFIDTADVLNIIQNFTGSDPVGKPISSFSLGDIENSLEKDVWIRNAELFFDNNEMLRVSIDEREPIARVFSLSGKSFYIDSSIHVLPLSDKFSARLPVFTGYGNNPEFVSKADSALLQSIKLLSLELQADSFLMAMIEQVDITPQRKFEMLPKIGSQVIVFGNAENAEQKFEKLRLFYKSVITRVGWSKYSIINLEYKNQVVAKIKDAADKSSDSLRALQIMQIIADRAAKQAADSSLLAFPDTPDRGPDSTMILQSMQRDEMEGSQEFIPEDKPVVTPVVVSKPVDTRPVIAPPKKPPVKKPDVKKPPAVKPAPVKKPAAKQPKAVMGKQ